MKTSFLIHPTLLLLIAAVAHGIHFPTHELSPASLAYDPTEQHFLGAITHSRTILFATEAGVIQTLITDHALPEQSSFVALTVDDRRRRLIAAVSSPAALAAYDLRQPQRRIFLTVLDNAAAISSVALDPAGNAYVTDSAGDRIWKVNLDGQASDFAAVPGGAAAITHVGKGYFLVVDVAGKLIKVRESDGASSRVSIGAVDLSGASAITVRRDGTAFVAWPEKVWVLKSSDSWEEGVVFDEIALGGTSLALGREERVYMMYQKGSEGKTGIDEIRSEKENRNDVVWIYVLIGFGLLYFTVWRFQMKSLITNMDKKNY